MSKRFNKYKLHLEEVELKSGESGVKAVEFEFENHDDIFNIIEFLKTKTLFNNPNEDLEFTIGLKMFSEVMLKNKNNPLFEDFLPAFGKFMKELKSK